MEMATITAEYDQDLYYLGGYVSSDNPYGPEDETQMDYSPCICDFSRKDPATCLKPVYGNCSCKGVPGDGEYLVSVSSFSPAQPLYCN